MEEKNNNALYCAHCGALIEEGEDYEEVNGQPVCTECYENHTVTCDRCGEVIWSDDSYGDEYTTLCRHCYENHYVRCSCCSALLHEDDAYTIDGDYYCSDCYHDEVDKSRSIHDYGYKPDPIFYGDSKRYFGVELEIDGAGKDSDNADEILAIANRGDEHIYIKGDGSLDDGIELVTHPMSLEYHKNYQWVEIMKKAISLGYRSHQTSTCGLHIHVNRSCLGDNRDEQDETISRILFFVEANWNELLRFSRRSEYSINRWAARYGYEKTGREILDKAKKGCQGRYAAVNLMNYATIEFRMFRGTLKLNTFLATLELVNAIIDVALNYSEEWLHKLSYPPVIRSVISDSINLRETPRARTKIYTADKDQKWKYNDIFTSYPDLKTPFLLREASYFLTFACKFSMYWDQVIVIKPNDRADISLLTALFDNVSYGRGHILTLSNEKGIAQAGEKLNDAVLLISDDSKADEERKRESGISELHKKVLDARGEFLQISILLSGFASSQLRPDLYCDFSGLNGGYAISPAVLCEVLEYHDHNMLTKIENRFSDFLEVYNRHMGEVSLYTAPFCTNSTKSHLWQNELSTELASQLKRSQFCIQLNTLMIIEIDIFINEPTRFGE